MSLIDSVRKAARINSTALDDEIERLIIYAGAELERSGVPSEVVAGAENNPLVSQALISFTLSEIMDNPDDQTRAKESWEYQREVLRKHSWR